MNVISRVMKTFTPASAVLVVVSALGSGTASASLIASETWAYANGSVVQGLNGGTGWADAWQQQNGQNTMTVENGALVDTGGNPISAGSERMLAATESAGTIWIGFESNFVNASGGSDELRFLDSGTTTGAFGGNGPNTTGNTGPNKDYNFLDSNLAINTPPSVDLGVGVGTGPHFTLMEINYTTDTTTIWMNPDLYDLGAGITAAFAPDFNEIELFAKPGGSFGSLLIGTTEADAIPEPASLALFGTASLGLILASRRRRFFDRA